MYTIKKSCHLYTFSVFFSPWHFFGCPWQFSQKCPWHRKNARDNFGPKKVAVTFFWVAVTKIAKTCPWHEILAVTIFDIKIKVPVTLKNVPVTFFAIFFFSLSTRNYSLLKDISLPSGICGMKAVEHEEITFFNVPGSTPGGRTFFINFKSLFLLIGSHLLPRPSAWVYFALNEDTLIKNNISDILFFSGICQ